MVPLDMYKKTMGVEGTVSNARLRVRLKDSLGLQLQCPFFTQI